MASGSVQCECYKFTAIYNLEADSYTLLGRRSRDFLSWLLSLWLYQTLYHCQVMPTSELLADTLFHQRGKELAPWRAEAGPAHTQVESTGYFALAPPRRQTLSPGWTGHGYEAAILCRTPHFWEEHCLCVQCEMHALHFLPPISERIHSEFLGTFPGAEVSYNTSSLNEALLF